MKLRKLPSMRDKSRYVFFRVHSEGRLDFPEVRNAIMNSLLNWLGDSNTALAKPWVIKNLWSHKEQNGVIKCTNRFVDDVKLSLGLIHQIGDHRVIFQTLRVSGTIKSGRSKIRKG